MLPVYNEAESLPILWEELVAVLDKSGWSAEVIFVDDGSTDRSADTVRRLAHRAPRIRLIRLKANAGLSAALAVGLVRARGPIVVTMDTDLQHDPWDIPRLVAQLTECDLATGWRVNRHDPWWLKRFSSRVANRIRDRVTGDHVHDSASTLRAMHRRCLADLPLFQGFHRFVSTLLRMAGHRVVELPVNHRPRRFGVSNYGIRNRVGQTFVDLLAVHWMQSRQLRYDVVEDS